MQEKKTIKIFLLLGDIFITQIALFLTLFLRNRDLPSQFTIFSYNFIVVYVVWILILFTLNLYDIYFLKKPIDFFFNIIIFSTCAIFSVVAYFFFSLGFGLRL